MTRLWDQLEGVNLAGAYGLEQFLESERNGAWFRTAFGPEQRPATLKLVSAFGSDGEHQLALWRKTAQLSHPNLLALLDCGRAEVEGEPFLYAVFECPDDSLASALANGPLSPPEVDDVMAAAEDALRYIHDVGMTHAAVDAGHIVAVGDLIKLTSESLRNSDDDGADASVDDLALGPLREHLRTGVKPEPLVLSPRVRISEPAPIARLEEPPAAAKDIEVGAVAPPPRALPPGPVVTAAPSSPALTLPIPKRAPALPLLLAAIGAVVVAILLAVTQRGTPDAPWTPVASAAPAAPAATPPTTPAAAISPAPAPDPPVAKPDPAPAVTRRPAAPARIDWRVIAYTYNRREHAEHKVETINREKPGFHASVFAPKGPNQAPFFVSLGGRMTREAALALRRKARSKGLPRDTFARNFSN